MSLMDELVQRTHPGAKVEREIIEAALGAAAVVKQEADAVRGDRRLSQAGMSAKIVEFALSHPWAYLQQQRAKAKVMGEELVQRRASMVPPPADPTNVAAAVLNQELRQMLRASSRADRLRHARADDSFAVAALTAPAILSGFDEKTIGDLDLIRANYQQRNFTELFAGLALRDEALAVVNLAIESASRQILNEAGITESDVGRILTPEVDETQIDPNDPSTLPVITRQQFREWQTNDPGRAAAEMKKVYQGFARLVD
jgi:hypothetical protein